MSPTIRDEQDIYDSIESGITDKIDDLNNFTDGSFNDALTNAYSDELYEAEIRAFAAYLAGYAEYAGRDLTPTDLDVLGIDTADPAEINAYIESAQLDNLAANVGIERESPVNATGFVEFTIDDPSVEVPDGFEVGTNPAGGGERLIFKCDVTGTGTIDEDSDETVSPEVGQDTLEVAVIADEPGREYNILRNEIGFMPNPIPGITDVTNPEPITGAEDGQSNEELRRDLQNAIFEQSAGSSVPGIEGYISRFAESDVESVTVNEYLWQPDVEDTPRGDVIVYGGEPTEIRELISEARPSGIEHQLVRPTVVDINATVDVVGDGLDADAMQQTLFAYFDRFEIGDRYYTSEALNTITRSHTAAETVPALNTYVDDVGNDRYVYESGTTTYPLRFAWMGRVVKERHYVHGGNEYQAHYSDIDDSWSGTALSAVLDGDRVDLVQGTDYTISDSNSSGELDSIELTGVEPDDGTVLQFTYKHDSWTFSSIITDENGDEYFRGGDWELDFSVPAGFPVGISWLNGGNSPDDGTVWSATYSPARLFRDDFYPTVKDTDDIYTPTAGDPDKIETLIEMENPANVTVNVHEPPEREYEQRIR